MISETTDSILFYQFVESLAESQDAGGNPIFAGITKSEADSIAEDFLRLASSQELLRVKRIAALALFMHYFDETESPHGGWAEDVFSKDEIAKAIMVAASMQESSRIPGYDPNPNDDQTS